MDPLIGAGIGLFGGLLNNIFAGSRQEDQQNFNAQQAAIAAQFNAQQAEINRQFQGEQADASRIFTRDFGREMADRSAAFSNTAWQRGVADMRAAGINPILAASKGSASTPSFAGGSSPTPSGSSASMQAASASAQQVFDIVGPAISSAKAVQEIANMKASQAETEARTVTEKNRPENVAQQTRTGKAEEHYVETRANREGLLMPEARVRGKQAVEVEKLLDEDIMKYRTLIQAGAISEQASKILAPVSDLVGTGMRMLSGASSARTQSLDRAIRGDTFENLWGYRAGRGP